MLPPGVCLSSERTLRLAAVSVAVIATRPGAVELLITALYVPFPLFLLCATRSRESEEENTTVSIGTGLP
jgi:hypothetical protein